jgi:glycosyltransferase involved in cell wall biosynthesis
LLRSRGWLRVCGQFLPYGQPVRIIHISDCFAPRTGGIETQVLGLAQRQRAAGHEVTVLTATPAGRDVSDGLLLDEAGNSQGESVGGVPVIRIASRMPFDLPVHPNTRTHVLRYLRFARPDVVHVHAGSLSPFAWGGIRAARQGRIPIVVTVHSMWDAVSREGNRLLARTPWGFDTDSRVVVTAVGSLAAQRVREALGHDVMVLPNGIDPGEWRVSRMPADSEVLRVVSVLRMAPRKRALPLMGVLHQAITRTAGGITATLIGDGPELGRVRRYVERNELGGFISCVGALPRTRIRAHYATADVFAQASVRESFGIAALEARTSGLAVVARSQSGTSDFVHDQVEGLLAKDDQGLVDALVALHSDRPLLDSIIEHNCAVPPDQAWPSVLDRVQQAYDMARDARSRALG